MRAQNALACVSLTRGSRRRGGSGNPGRRAGASAGDSASRPRAGTSTAAPDKTLLAAVRQAIAAAGGSAGKADVVAAAGISDTQCNAAIAALLAAGAVTKTGAGRDTRYQLNGPG
ncbi:hypothetical protein CKO31_25900 [Thiohalocapsa halophila]|uniref:MarR family transcriptional regulator n=1 Tax=Thiohalocapsa halophila TaxID=69359 RepID=A0ABS1CQ79_9GAMM|nr:hypothetical protein [Thiohalocapsa halophila]MBK1634086.1 hypothetical protein [Thiohalocapsa halophila]